MLEADEHDAGVGVIHAQVMDVSRLTHVCMYADVMLCRMLDTEKCLQVDLWQCAVLH